MSKLVKVPPLHPSRIYSGSRVRDDVRGAWQRGEGDAGAADQHAAARRPARAVRAGAARPTRRLPPAARAADAARAPPPPASCRQVL